jgi:hypothetical protein
VTYSVNDRYDGAEEAVATGNMDLDSSDYELMGDGTVQIVAIVFPDVNIGAGVTIMQANVIFEVDEVHPGTSDQGITISIYGELTGNAAQPSGVDFDLSTRTPTSTTIVWEPESSGSIGDLLITPNLAPIISEIIALPEWSPGNSMAIVFGYVAGTGSRWVEAYDTGTPMKTPALQIATGSTSLQSGTVSSPPIFLFYLGFATC